jgi:hypothetical protein
MRRLTIGQSTSYRYHVVGQQERMSNRNGKVSSWKHARIKQFLGEITRGERYHEMTQVAEAVSSLDALPSSIIWAHRPALSLESGFRYDEWQHDRQLLMN